MRLSDGVGRGERAYGVVRRIPLNDHHNWLLPLHTSLKYDYSASTHVPYSISSGWAATSCDGEMRLSSFGRKSRLSECSQTWSSCSADFSKARCIDCTPEIMLSSEISPSPFFSNSRKIERMRASVG